MILVNIFSPEKIYGIWHIFANKEPVTIGIVFKKLKLNSLFGLKIDYKSMREIRVSFLLFEKYFVRPIVVNIHIIIILYQNYNTVIHTLITII